MRHEQWTSGWREAGAYAIELQGCTVRVGGVAAAVRIVVALEVVAEFFLTRGRLVGARVSQFWVLAVLVVAR